MHELELAVHPWGFKEDRLKYMSTLYEETQLYFDSGIDGLFCELPEATYLNFEHISAKANKWTIGKFFASWIEPLAHIQHIM